MKTICTSKSFSFKDYNVTFTSGNEGNPNDPYGFDEFKLKNSSGEVIIHNGALASYLILPDGSKLISLDYKEFDKILKRNLGFTG